MRQLTTRKAMHHIKKLKSGKYGVFSSEQASKDCLPQYTTRDRDSAELIIIRLKKERANAERNKSRI